MRFPDAIPLHSVMAPKITAELMKWVGRVEIAKEVVTDQGTNSMSRFHEVFVKQCK